VLQFQTRIVWDVTRVSVNIGTFRRNRCIPRDKGSWFLGKLALDYQSAVHDTQEDNQRRALNMADLLKFACCTCRAWCKIQFVRPTLHELKCEHDKYTVSYMFRHFLSVIIRESLYRLKLCPPNCFATSLTSTHIKIWLKTPEIPH
jgi:hypothetical protein